MITIAITLASTLLLIRCCIAGLGPRCRKLARISCVENTDYDSDYDRQLSDSVDQAMRDAVKCRRRLIFEDASNNENQHNA